jgi:hypothetical protein
VNNISWPVAVLAVITLLAGAVVGDALRSAMGLHQTADAGVYYATNSGK